MLSSLPCFPTFCCSAILHLLMFLLLVIVGQVITSHNQSAASYRDAFTVLITCTNFIGYCHDDRKKVNIFCKFFFYPVYTEHSILISLNDSSITEFILYTQNKRTKHASLAFYLIVFCIKSVNIIKKSKQSGTLLPCMHCMFSRGKDIPLLLSFFLSLSLSVWMSVSRKLLKHVS